MTLRVADLNLSACSGLPRNSLFMLTSDVSASSESVAISMIRLLFSTAAFELEAMVVAMRRASASNSDGSDTEFTSPQRKASSASTLCPVSIHSFAFAAPTSLGSVDAATTSPYSAPGHLNVADDEAIRMSQPIASLAPPP